MAEDTAAQPQREGLTVGQLPAHGDVRVPAARPVHPDGEGVAQLIQGQYREKIGRHHEGGGADRAVTQLQRAHEVEVAPAPVLTAASELFQRVGLTERLHSALDYLPPEEFEAATTDPRRPRTLPETIETGRYETQGSSGCTNAWKLWEEIVPLGYQGSYARVRAYLRLKRTSPRPAAARPPSPRAVAGWILRRPETLSES
ncbi:hypothetical protein P8A22_02360 [Streptomyces laculatispora]|uniref:Transposase n=1 Tax=Streptomyces laculatispora TaxID=887464 RepID=A0ABY9IF44_9ACTN|nr:hypothetical protein [Streptomyces laculatispora]WLQ45575.1 hypothetical protein P8A22_02360 [Streptomyces laculatispora]